MYYECYKSVFSQQLYFGWTKTLLFHLPHLFSPSSFHSPSELVHSPFLRSILIILPTCVQRIVCLFLIEAIFLIVDGQNILIFNEDIIYVCNAVGSFLFGLCRKI